MKRTVLIILSLVFVLSLALAFTACDGEGSAEATQLVLHYKRNNPDDYKTWGFWIWLKGGDGKLYKMNETDDFGGVASYPLSDFGATSTSTIGIIPRLLSGWTKDVDKDRMLNLAECKADSKGRVHIWLFEGDENLYKDLGTMKYTFTASFSSADTITVSAKTPIKNVKVLEDGELFFEQKVDNAEVVQLKVPSGKAATLGKSYSVEVTFKDGKKETGNVNAMSLAQAIYDSKDFYDSYYYDGELGAIYSQSATVFRVWSPISTKIVLNIYTKGNGAETPQATEMTKGAKGVFEATVSGDCAGKYYTYRVYNAYYPDGAEIVDPYAKSAGLDGKRGMVVDFATTNPVGWADVSPVAYDRKELVVWETHVADVTSSETWNGTEAYRKKFLGLIEGGTTYTKDDFTVKTGFDHIKELGVNAVQLVPIFDQANDETKISFNWGYNPLNYNVLEGCYSTNPSDGYVRISEFKQVVKAFNAEGINIIMDVVYNHVAGAEGSNFDVLMPGYYFRYNEDGTLSNGSGCGNETASDRAMFRKFMIDSVCFWAKEYKLGGFRFDLMGLHDIETMNLLVAELQKINPAIVVYGEPWTGGNSPLSEDLRGIQKNADKFVGYGQFNDQMRDALIKGGMKGVEEIGWATTKFAFSQEDVKAILDGLRGSTTNATKDPNKTVNYVTCHDNYTLYDRVYHALGTKNAESAKKMAMLANSVVFSSNGTTFMLAGEEFLRTKDGNGNSYESSYKVNELDYALKVENYDMFCNYKALISFKRTCGGLHLEQSEIAESYYATALYDGAVIRIDIQDGEKTWIVLHANGSTKNATVDLSGYTLYLDTLNTEGLELTAETALQPFQTIIVYK